MILLRAVIFLSLACAGIWFFLAEPDRRAALDAIEQRMEAEADQRQAKLSQYLLSRELSAALIARSAPVAAILTERPEPEPQEPAALGAFEGTRFARPAPQPVTVPDEQAKEQALQELKSLEALTGLTAIRILKKGEADALPPVSPPAAMTANGLWQAGIDGAFDGQTKQIAFAGADGQSSFVVFTPYFDGGDVPAIIIAEARLSEAKSQWKASEYRLSLTDDSGSVILSNSTKTGGEPIETSREVPEIKAVMTIATSKPALLGPWAERSGFALALAILVLLLWEVSLSRRRIRAKMADATRLRPMSSEPVASEQSKAPENGRGQEASGESLALLAQVSEAVGQEVNRPLSALRNHAEAATRALDSGEVNGARDELRHVFSLADRMERVIANMRGFEAAQPYQIEPVSIRPVVHDAAVKLLERDPVLGDFFFLEVADDMAEKTFVRADKSRLSQVIGSLLSASWNACRDREAPELVISIQQTDDDVIIAVDYGGQPAERIGPEDKPANSGDTKATVGPVTKGVSYSIAKSVVEAMGGALTSRASALGGSRIEISIPKFRPNAT